MDRVKGNGGKKEGEMGREKGEPGKKEEGEMREVKG